MSRRAPPLGAPGQRGERRDRNDVQDWLFKRGRRERVVDWLGLDSRIDSTLAETWARLRDVWNAGTSFFARFRLTGWKRLLNEAASEGLTLGAGGFVVMFALAIPAFHEFDEGKFLTGQFAVKFLDQNGNEIGKRGILHNDAVPLDDIPDPLVKATLATEDRRFFEHWGIDVFGTVRALVTNLQANEVVQGGSSITQQVAKNLFLSSERSLHRKIKEAFLALLLESRFTKRDILKLYFDRAYMGGGAFGVEAASQSTTSASRCAQINLAEAALLAGLFKAPTKYAPHVNLPASRARTNEVLNNLVEAGFYTAGQVHWARMHPAKTIENRNPNSPDWFLDWAFEEVQRIAAGNEPVRADGAHDRSTSTCRRRPTRRSPRRSRQYRGNRITSGAIVLMETDGAVRALTGGPDYGESQFNRATHARRQPGSSFKIYVYAAALENGYTPTTVGARRLALVRPLASAELRRQPRRRRAHAAVDGARQVDEYGRGRALVRRRSRQGHRDDAPRRHHRHPQDLLDGARRLRHQPASSTPAASPPSPTAASSPGRTPSSTSSTPRAISSTAAIATSRKPPQVVERKVAEGLNWMMQKVVTDGTGQRAALDFTNVVGKTGTSTGPKDVWFVGATGKYVGTVWLGNDDNRPMSGGTTGGVFATPVWHSFMSVVHTDMNIPTIPGLRAASGAGRRAAAHRRTEAPKARRPPRRPSARTSQPHVR